MNFRKISKSNRLTIKPAFLLLFLAISLTAMFMLTAYAAEDATPPAKPSGFETNSDASTINLKWLANSEAGLAGYNIYRNTTDTTVGAKLASVEASATSYQDTSVAQGTTYYYWLSAIDTASPANESDKAGPVSASLTSSKQPDTVNFKDIINAPWARTYIEELLASGIVNGYADGTFRPQSDVTRAEFAKMICEIMVKRANWTLSTETSSSLTDVQADHWAFTYIETAKKYGVMVGYKTADGTSFKPDRNITRAEIAKIISTVLKLERGQSKLKDIGSHWAKEHINSCVKAGIVSGYENGHFKPSSFATRAEVCKMLVKMMKRLDTQKNKSKSTQ